MGAFLRDANTSSAPSRRAKSAPYGARRTIIASAQRIDVQRAQPLQKTGLSTWQRDAWDAYDAVGEIHHAFSLQAALLSRLRLYIGEVGATNEPPRDVTSTKDIQTSQEIVDKATELLAELISASFPSLVSKFSLCMSVAGEVYLVRLPPPTQRDGEDAGQEPQWVFCSSSELIPKSGSITYRPYADQSTASRELPANTYLARVWRQHPRYSKEADSSLRALGDPVAELRLLGQLVRGYIRSRMNSGMLFLPDGIEIAGATTGSPPIDEQVSVEDLATASIQDPGNALTEQITEQMTIPISDEGSAAAVVPIVLTGPTDIGASIRYITFDRPSDSWLIDRDTKALDRILNGIEVPKEVITGMQAVKYSNAVVIDDSMYKATIEPSALTLADAITDAYLRPMLIAAGYSKEDISKVVVWYDPSEIVTRPNAADDATEGYDRFLLSRKAWRREHGFPESDAPSPEEVAEMLALSAKTIPPQILVRVLKQMLDGAVDLDGVGETPAELEPSDDGSGVRQFPRSVPDVQSPEADPQATAIKQVGVQ